MKCLAVFFILQVLPSCSMKSAFKYTNSKSGLRAQPSATASGAFDYGSLGGIEASLMAMAAEGATPELEPFIEQIATLTAQMKAEVEATAHASEVSLNTSWEDFLNCALSSGVAEDLSGYNTTHLNCRASESGLYTDLQDCLEICNAKNGTAQSACSVFSDVDHYPVVGDCMWQSTHESETTLDYMKILRDDFTLKLDRWQTKKGECDTRRSEADSCYEGCLDESYLYGNKTLECDQKQSNLESAGCGENGDACQTYDTCYETNKQAWNDTNKTVAVEEVSFKAEYRAILRIECLLEGFTKSINNESELSQEIETCRNTSFATSEHLGHLDIHYFDLSENPKQSCYGSTGDTNYLPGTDAWISSYYSGMPVNTHFAACDASCCGQFSCSDDTCPDGYAFKDGAVGSSTEECCDAVNCPADSSGSGLPTGCTCDYGYNGDIAATGSAPYFTGSCQANVCYCENGVAATGDQCAAQGEPTCASCDTGYHLHGSTCDEDWSMLSEDKACEENSEGINATFGAYNLTLDSCKAECQSAPFCQGIDFYNRTGFCNLYDVMCTDPQGTRAGASSYRFETRVSSSG